MAKEEVVCRGGVAGGRGFGDRGTSLLVLPSRFAHGPSRATRARWPDLQATASAADPFDFMSEIGVCCVLLICVLLIVVCLLSFVELRGAHLFVSFIDLCCVSLICVLLIVVCCLALICVVLIDP